MTMICWGRGDSSSELALLIVEVKIKTSTKLHGSREGNQNFAERRQVCMSASDMLVGGE